MKNKESLKDQQKEAKRQMKLARPLKGYLGNQYNYWEKQYNKLTAKLKQK